MHCFSSSVVGYLLSIFIDIRFDIIGILEVSQLDRCFFGGFMIMKLLFFMEFIISKWWVE